MSKETAKVLSKARRILSKRGAWTKGFFALDSAGREVDAFGKEAVCFCAMGACQQAVGSYGYPYYEAVDALEKVIKVKDIGTWQDEHSRTKRQVLAVFDKAIAAERRK